jgi:hypothetical protein
VAGAGELASQLQQTFELRRMSKKTREEVCENAGVRNKLQVSSRLHLAMKTSMGLTWYQMRKQRRMFSALGVKFENETLTVGYRRPEIDGTLVKLAAYRKHHS